MSKKFPSVSMSLKLSTADWLPKNRTTSPATKKLGKKVSKRRSIETNDDKLLRRPIAIQKEQKKNFVASLPNKHKERRRANHKKTPARVKKTYTGQLMKKVTRKSID